MIVEFQDGTGATIASVDIPDSLFSYFKSSADRTGVSVEDYIVNIVTEYVEILDNEPNEA